ncbi:MAG: polysaccharide biosynthesis/export family protein [Candidatus Auribacterota bacterium]|nr:polysaccharide biosynthesis/export family protein [Candidatus Auribacterota bacterium]
MMKLTGRISALIIIAVFIIPLTTFGITDTETNKLIAEGQTLLDLGQTEDARQIFQQVLADDPQNTEARSYLQQIDGSESKSSPSTDNRQPAPPDLSGSTVNSPSDGSPQELEEEPEPFVGHEDMVVPEPFEDQVSGENDEEQIEEDLPRSPRRRVHHFYRQGLEAYEAKNYSEAIRSFEEVQNIKPDYRRADYYRRKSWEFMAALESTREMAEEAAVEEIIEKKSYDAYSRGKEYMRYGKYEAAIKEFQQVLDREPDHQGAKGLQEEARLKLEKTAFEDEVAAAEQLAEEEAKVRTLSEEEEDMAVREAYYEGEQLYKAKKFESSRRKFSEIEEKRGRHRRTGFYMRKIDRELWEKKEQELVDFEAEAIRKYTLGPEDRVRVVVRNHPEFDFEADVEEGGELIIPLTNEIITADGLTRDDLAEEIRQYLTAYIDNPFVSVFITEYNSKKYYVLQPKGGGSEFVMDKSSMTLWDCMFRAGIPTLDSAAMRRIQVITPHKTHPTHRWINVYAMLYQGKMEDNIRIEPGTIIYYPMLATDKFTMTLEAITRPFKAMVTFSEDYEEWDDFRKEYLR